MLSSDATSGVIRLYDGRGGDKPLETIDTVHKFPVHIMTVCFVYLGAIFWLLTFILIQYSDQHNTVISADEGGFIEYWQPNEPFTLPANFPKSWTYKSETDLYEFKKA